MEAGSLDTSEPGASHNFGVGFLFGRSLCDKRHVAIHSILATPCLDLCKRLLALGFGAPLSCVFATRDVHSAGQYSVALMSRCQQ